MKNKLKDREIWISAFLSLILIGIYVFAMHDKQVADGIGLFIATKMGKENRAVFDLAADAVRLVLLLSAIYIPVLVCHRGIVSMFRLLTVYLAFLPIADASFWVHLLYGGKKELIQILSVRMNWTDCVSNGMELMRIVVLLILFFFLPDGLKENKILYKNVKNTILAVIATASFILLAIFPGLKEVFFWTCSYPLLLIVFDCWEKAMEQKQTGRMFGWCLFGLCFLRVCLRMLQIMSNAHL